MRPTSLEINGLLSYKNYQHLDLSNIEFAAIVGENGAGKSSLLDCMMFALFGSVDGNNLDLVLTTGVDEGSATLEFAFDSNLWRVTRTRVRNKRTVAQLSRWDDYTDQWEIVADGSVRAVDGEVQRLLRVNEAAFRATVMLSQNEASSFSSATPAERKEILGRIIGLDRYTRLAAAAKKRADDVKAQSKTRVALLEQLERRTEDEEALRAELESVERDLDTFEAQRTESEGLAERADAHKREKENAVEALRNAIAAKKEVFDQQRVDIERACERAREEHEENERELGAVSASLDEKLSLLGDDNITDALRKEEERLAELSTSIDGLIVEGQATADESKTLAVHKAELEANLRSAEERKKLLSPSSTTADGRCWVCDTPLDDDHRERLVTEIDSLIASMVAGVEKAAADYDDNEKEVAALRGHLKKIRAEKTVVEQQVKELRDRERAQEKLVAEVASLEQQKKELGVRCAKSRGQLNDELLRRDKLVEDPQITKAQEKLAEAEKQLETIPGGETHRAKAAHAAAQTRSLSNRKAVLLSKLAQVESDKEEQVALRRDVASLDAEERKFSLLRQAFGRDGIPALIYAGVVVELNEHINSILGYLSDGQLAIELVTTKETKKGTLSETLDVMIVAPDGARPYVSFSGGEKFRIDIALRLGLSRLLANRHGAKMEFLAIDEGWGSLDPQGISAMISELNKLRRDFSLILTVTHIDAIREGFGTLIHVSKTAAGSQIEVE